MILQRDSQDGARTYGILQSDTGIVECQTIERPWLDNQNGVSCIPAGVYPCALRFSPHHGFAVFGVTNVPHRTDVEIHAANVPTQLLGCIALGETRGTLNGQDAVMASQNAVDTFMAARGCAGYRELTTDAKTQAWITAHPTASRFTLAVRDPQ